MGDDVRNSGLTKKVLEKPKEGGCALRADESRGRIALTPSHLWQTRDPSTPGPTTRRSREQLPLAEAATIRRARAPAEQRADLLDGAGALTDEEEERAALALRGDPRDLSTSTRGVAKVQLDIWCQRPAWLALVRWEK